MNVVGGSKAPVGSGKIGGSRENHEVRVAALDIKWIVGLQGNEHGAAPSLGDEIEAMVEELAKQRKPLIERSSAIGRGVRDKPSPSQSTAGAAGFL